MTALPKPPPDAHELLLQLQGIIEERKEAPTKGGGKDWIGTLIILITVLVGVAVWSWVSWRRGKELAKLRHEKNKAKILKEKAELEKKLTKNKIIYLEAAERISEAEKVIEQTDLDIQAEERRYEADMRAIDSIRSWRDAGIR